ncbi:hypothetical protein ACO0LD_03090 [Undibacterium sp. Ji83W]|uniref:hypothetical protein n=1 Tax=Undibacterium sp. Ji83W TaxID=3413043 RepID=UPI003BF0494B
MILSISPQHLEARQAGSLTHLDAGSGHARVRIYNGVQPAFGGPETQMLVEVALTKPAGIVAGGVLSLTVSTFGLIAVTGQATWARVVNGNGEIAFDCDVTDAAGNGVIQLESTQLYAGGKAFLTALNLG